MAPLENGGFQQSVWDGERRQPIDSLMRALLYIAQQVGRPVGEADIRRLAVLPLSGLDESAFLMAGKRLGLEAYAVDLAGHDNDGRLNDLPTPFALVGAPDQPAYVVVAGGDGQWTVLDVVEGRVWRLATDEVMALGVRALVMRETAAHERRQEWYAPLWARVRPVVLKLAAMSFVINLLGLATPLFMMLVFNAVIGRDGRMDAAATMTMLCVGMVIAYALDFRHARGAAPGRHAGDAGGSATLAGRATAGRAVVAHADAAAGLVAFDFDHFDVGLEHAVDRAQQLAFSRARPATALHRWRRRGRCDRCGARSPRPPSAGRS